jgi:hypothetical protein
MHLPAPSSEQDVNDEEVALQRQESIDHMVVTSRQQLLGEHVGSLYPFALQCLYTNGDCVGLALTTFRTQCNLELGRRSTSLVVR